MNETLALRKLELKHNRAERNYALIDSTIKGTVEVAKTALLSPAVSVPLAVALIEYLASKRVINETERALLVAAILSKELLSALGGLGGLASLVKAA